MKIPDVTMIDILFNHFITKIIYTHIFVFLSLLLQTLSVYHFCHFLLFHLLKCCCLCLGPQIILVSICQQSVNLDFLSGLFVSFAISPQN